VTESCGPSSRRTAAERGPGGPVGPWRWAWHGEHGDLRDPPDRRASRGGRAARHVGYATSGRDAGRRRGARIPLLALELDRRLDVTIDGADEVEPGVDLIKGGGGAHLREKIVAQASDRERSWSTSRSSRPGSGRTMPLPLRKVLEFGWASQARYVGVARRGRSRCGCGRRPAVTAPTRDNLVLGRHVRADRRTPPRSPTSSRPGRDRRARPVLGVDQRGVRGRPGRRAPPHASLSSLRWRKPVGA